MSTTAPASRHDVNSALEAVSQIDFSPINRKLQSENPAQWTDETLAEAETNYRRFLALNLLYPSTTLSVNKIVDEYWHQHILDTRKYAADCEKVFGYFLHHYPYFGIAGEEDRKQNADAFSATARLWEGAFGASMVSTPKLTLDKVLGGYQREIGEITKERVYAYPQACKNGQHCKKAIVDSPVSR
jgi:hypothetical protein